MLHPQATGDEIMSMPVARNEVAEDQLPTARAQASTACGTNTCAAGFCSPSVILWGLVAVYFIVTNVLELFR